MTDLPASYVDPTDPAAVAGVLRATALHAGLDAVADLLVRLPGTRTDPGAPGGLFRRAVPPSIWVGPEWCWSRTAPPELIQVVGGVALHRTPLEPGTVGDALGRAVADLVGRTGAVADASAVLTAARDLSDS